MVGTLTSDLLVWGLTFALGSIFGWLAWLTLSHFRHGRRAHNVLKGDDMLDGYVQQTNQRLEALEQSQERNTERLTNLETELKSVDGKTDIILTLLRNALGEDTGVLSDSLNDLENQERQPPTEKQ